MTSGASTRKPNISRKEASSRRFSTSAPATQRPSSRLRSARLPADDDTASDPIAPLTSVVVPTRDRPAPLSACLDALSAQTAVDRLEVIVVDDGSVAAAAEVAAVVARHPRARL